MKTYSLPSLADIEGWFAGKGWKPFPFQTQVWDAIAKSRHGLLHSSTGSGKTAAVWLGFLLANRVSHPLSLLWITPMRALAKNTRQALEDPIPFAPPVGLWTGDTPASTRRKLTSNLPHALITTPESLCLMLSRPDLQQHLQRVQGIVIDEWHELLGTKRGALLELALARIRSQSPQSLIWGLSATLGNLQQAAHVLVPANVSEFADPANSANITRPTDLSEAVVVRGESQKEVHIETLLPPEDVHIPWAGHLGMNLILSVSNLLKESSSTILFTNTRSQAELWFHRLRELLSDFPMALHHSSMDCEVRTSAEDGLRDGSLRCVVATSSLDLGVDFSPVEQVIQVGSPKGVARLLQRAGRSGHRPGVPSRVICVPVNTLELLEVAAVRRLAVEGRIEARYPVERALDVLCQHVVTVACGQDPGSGLDEAAFMAEVRGTHAFRDLTEGEWEWVMDFVARGGKVLSAYRDFRKIWRRGGRFGLAEQALLARHRMSVGAITGDASVEVRMIRGGRLGTVEESFAAKLRTGDTFLFAGRRLSMVRMRDMRMEVRPARGAGGNTPRWMGGKMPLSTELGAGVREELARGGRSPEWVRLEPLLEIQRSLSVVPDPEELLVEKIRTREGHHVFVYPFAGRVVHEALAALLAWRLAQREPLSFSFAVNDYGLELLSPSPVPPGALADVLSPSGLHDDLPSALNASEATKRKFREIARVAGLTFEGFPGRRKSTRQVQVSSGLLFDVFTKYDPANLLLAQAHRETLEGEFRLPRLEEALEGMSRARVVVTEPERLTPLAYPLYAERLRAQLSTEEFSVRLARMEARIENAAHRTRRRTLSAAA